jgi:hypothetical protein
MVELHSKGYNARALNDLAEEMADTGVAVAM